MCHACAAWHGHRIEEEFQEVGEIVVVHSKSLVYLFEGQLGDGNHPWLWKCPSPDHGTQLRRQLWEEGEVGLWNWREESMLFKSMTAAQLLFGLACCLFGLRCSSCDDCI
jgi:hypothetical protein